MSRQPEVWGAAVRKQLLAKTCCCFCGSPSFVCPSYFVLINKSFTHTSYYNSVHFGRKCMCWPQYRLVEKFLEVKHPSLCKKFINLKHDKKGTKSLISVQK